MKISYDAPPIVSAFLDSDAFVRVIIGPLGSGKSSGCVVELLRRALEQEPSPDKVRRTRFVVIRNTRQQLQDTTRRTFEEWLPFPEELAGWNEQDFEYTVDFPLKDGTRVHTEVLFRALDRPKDVKKVLSLELTGAYLNELREIPKEVFDGVQGRVGRYPSKAKGGVGASWFGVWADTNPWAVGHWGHELFNTGKLPEGFEVFEQPSGLSPDAENVANLPDGYYQRLVHGKDEAWIDEYVRAKYPSSDKGSVYGSLIAALEQRGGISDFEHPTDGVFVNFDLGVSDSTAMWWWRFGPGRVPDILDWYEACGVGASHYISVLRGETPVGCDRPRRYQLAKIWLPHDARQRTFQTGVTTEDLFVEAFGRGLVAVGPQLDIQSGLTAGRWLLEQPIRIHTRCADGIKRLRAYRYEWDDDKKVFSKTPLHDWTSHTADDWRYVAGVVQTSEVLTRPDEPQPVKPVALPLHLTRTLDGLFEAHERAPRRKERF